MLDGKKKYVKSDSRDGKNGFSFCFSPLLPKTCQFGMFFTGSSPWRSELFLMEAAGSSKRSHFRHRNGKKQIKHHLFPLFGVRSCVFVSCDKGQMNLQVSGQELRAAAARGELFFQQTSHRPAPFSLAQVNIQRLLF